MTASLASLIEPCLKPDGLLVLLPKGDPEAIKFKSALPSEARATPELTSHPGMTLGLIVKEPVDHSEWLTYYVGIVPMAEGVPTTFDGVFVSMYVEGDECVLDVPGWHSVELAHLWLLRAAVKTYETREEKEGCGSWGGRAFNMNDDLSVSPKNAPDLVLGRYDRRKVLASELTWEVALSRHTFLGERINARARTHMLALVERGSPEACVLQSKALEVSTAGSVLALSSHPGCAIGLMKRYAPRGDKNHSLHDLQVVPLADGLTFAYDGSLLSTSVLGEECVLDIHSWRSQARTIVQLHQGDKAHGLRRAWEDNRWTGRAFTCNGDGTISPKNAPHLVLGIFTPHQRPSDVCFLQLNHSYIGAPKDADKLRLVVALLRESVHLAELHLEGNDLDDAGAKLVADALAVAKAPVEILNLNKNPISDAGLAPFFAPEFRKLGGLLVMGLQITDVSAQRFAAFLKGLAALPDAVAQVRGPRRHHMIDANPGITPLGEACVQNSLLFNECPVRIDVGFGKIEDEYLADLRLARDAQIVPVAAVRACATVLSDSSAPLLEHCVNMFVEIAERRPQQWLSFGIAVASECSRNARRVRAKSALRAQGYEHVSSIVQLVMRALVVEYKALGDSEWRVLESAAAGGCKTFLASAEAVAAHARYLNGAFGGYLAWYRGLPPDFWIMGESDQWLEHGTAAASKQVIVLRMLLLGCLQPFLLVLLTLVPDAKDWLNSPALQFTERVISRKHEHRFWVPRVARPHQVQIAWVADPIVVLVLACASDIAIAAACTLRPPSAAGDEMSAITLFAMLAVGGAIFTEVEQLLGGSQPTLLRELANHFSDFFNIVDMTGLGLAAVALTADACILLGPGASAGEVEDASGSAAIGRLLRAIAEGKRAGGAAAAPLLLSPGADGADGGGSVSLPQQLADMMSVAVVALWLRPLRMFYLSPTFGPYLYMLILILVEDVFKIVVLAASLALAFAGAQYSLHSALTARSTYDCTGFRETGVEDSGGLGSLLFGQMETFLGAGDTDFGCLRENNLYLPWIIQVRCDPPAFPVLSLALSDFPSPSAHLPWSVHRG